MRELATSEVLISDFDFSFNNSTFIISSSLRGPAKLKFVLTVAVTLQALAMCHLEMRVKASIRCILLCVQLAFVLLELT